jgi:hypothetical protein
MHEPAAASLPPAGAPPPPGGSCPVTCEDLEALLQKLKLLEFGLYGLQQVARTATLDVEDIGPFYRLAEEIGGDVLALRRCFLPRDLSEAVP